VNTSASLLQSETINADLNLVIENKNETNSSVVIWFKENQQTNNWSIEDIICIRQVEATIIPITNLIENVLYMFCLMDESTIASPLDCIVYIKRHADSTWIFESSKTITVTLILLAGVLIVALGIAIGFLQLNGNLFFEKRIQKKETLAKSEDADVFRQSINARKTSNITSYSDDNTMRTASTYVQYDTSTLYMPPLPERPPNMKILSEPIYSTVEEIYRY